VAHDDPLGSIKDKEFLVGLLKKNSTRKVAKDEHCCQEFYNTLECISFAVPSVLSVCLIHPFD
jgi:hypothetical protein